MTREELKSRMGAVIMNVRIRMEGGRFFDDEGEIKSR